VRKARCEHEQRYEYLRRVAGIYSATTRVHATFFPTRFFQDGFCKTDRCEGAQERTRARPLLAAFAFAELRKIESTAGRDVEFLASSPSRSAIEQVDRTINKKSKLRAKLSRFSAAPFFKRRRASRLNVRLPMFLFVSGLSSRDQALTHRLCRSEHCANRAAAKQVGGWCAAATMPRYCRPTGHLAPGWRSLACRSSVKAGADEKNSFAVNLLTHIGTELAILFITRSTWVMLRHLEGRRRQNSFSSVKGGSDDGSWIDPNFPWFQKDDWSDSENASSRASADNQPNFEFARTVEERNVSNAAPIGRVAKGNRRQQLMAATGGSTYRLSDACNPNDAVFGDRRVTPVFRGVPSLLADPAVEPISGAFRAVLAVWTG
jgi:hypothetical protein